MPENKGWKMGVGTRMLRTRKVGEAGEVAGWGVPLTKTIQERCSGRPGRQNLVAEALGALHTVTAAGALVGDVHCRHCTPPL